MSRTVLSLSLSVVTLFRIIIAQLKILSKFTEFNDYRVQTCLEFNDSVVKDGESVLCWIISVSKMDRHSLAPVPSSRSLLSAPILHEFKAHR